MAQDPCFGNCGIDQTHFKQRDLKVICELSRWTVWGLDYFFIPLISKNNATFPNVT